MGQTQWRKPSIVRYVRKSFLHVVFSTSVNCFPYGSFPPSCGHFLSKNSSKCILMSQTQWRKLYCPGILGKRFLQVHVVYSKSVYCFRCSNFLPSYGWVFKVKIAQNYIPGVLELLFSLWPTGMPIALHSNRLSSYLMITGPKRPLTVLIPEIDNVQAS